MDKNRKNKTTDENSIYNYKNEDFYEKNNKKDKKNIFENNTNKKENNVDKFNFIKRIIKHLYIPVFVIICSICGLIFMQHLLFSLNDFTIDNNNSETDIVTEKINIVKNPENEKWIKIKYDNETKNTMFAFYTKNENNEIVEKETSYDKLNTKNFMKNLYVYYELEENEEPYLIYAHKKSSYAKGFSIYLPKSEKDKDYYELSEEEIINIWDFR